MSDSITEYEKAERRRALAREYERKRREAKRAAKGLAKQTKPNEKQQFSLGTKDKPRDNRPKVDKKADVEARKAKVQSPQLEAYLAQLAAEKEAAVGGWWDDNAEKMFSLAGYTKGE